MWSFRDANRGERLARGGRNVVGQPVLTRLSVGLAFGLGARIAILLGVCVGECRGVAIG